MNTDQKRAYAATFPVHVGVDTAKTFHKLVARGPDGQRTKADKVLVSRAGFEAADAPRPRKPAKHNPKGSVNVRAFLRHGGSVLRHRRPPRPAPVENL